IARAVGCTDWTVRKWRRRSRAGPTLQDAPRPGGPRFFPLSGPGAGHRVGLHPAAEFRYAALPLAGHRARPHDRPAWQRPAHLRRDHSTLAPGRPHQALAIPQLATADRPALPGTGHPGPDPLRARPNAGPEGPRDRLRG